MSSDTNTFPVIDIDPGQDYRIEHLGTKEKFWIDLPDYGQCLVKFPRPNSGEDWAEKVAAELADQLGLPHASYELASMNGRPATLSKSFLPYQASLVHGNELLGESQPDYGQSVSKFRMSAHTVDAVIRVLNERCSGLPIGWSGLLEIAGPSELFVGYLLLDAWIGNTDRHHENWGVVRVLADGGEERVHLAPTYDHASSLGCREPDAKKQRRLETQDHRFSVEAYCEKARSALYASPGDSAPLTPLEAFRRAALESGAAGRIWISALDKVPGAEVVKLMNRVPSDRISDASRRFAAAILSTNRKRLGSILEQLQ